MTHKFWTLLEYQGEIYPFKTRNEAQAVCDSLNSQKENKHD